ncbi:hypothetical protein ACFL2X_00290 [Candidatus Latescibacterota bacterium]
MSENVSRRTFIGGAASLGITAIASSNASKSHALSIGSRKSSDTPEKSFMNQYYDGILEITRGIRDTQIDNIASAMEKAYELKRNGGSIYSSVTTGHYSMFAGSPDRPGQPGVLPQSVITPKDEEFDAMGKGDFLITNRIDPQAIEARKRGTYVVGITNNYNKFYKTPPNGLAPDKMKFSTEETSDLVIDSQVPWDNGLVYSPAIPHFKLCPSSGITQFLVYWACTASLSNLIGTKGKGSSTEPARKYLEMAYNRFEMIGTDRAKIDLVSEKWADRVLSNKARLLVHGHRQDAEIYGATGTANMFVNDASICASSTMIAEPYELKANELRPEDIVLIGAFTSDNKNEIEAARNARRVGAYSVAFCPYATDGDASGDRLFKEVDDAFNSYSDESAGVIGVDGFKEKVSPLAGLTGNLIHWLLTAQWTDHMYRRGEMPYFWQGYHENGGREYDNEVHPKFLKRGY